MSSRGNSRCEECGGACDGPACGMHAAGCYYGGPDGGAYWFAVDTCPLPHDGEIPPLVAPAENVHAALDHLRQAGLTITAESGS